MDASSKENLLRDVQGHVTETIRSIEQHLPSHEKDIADLIAGLKRGSAETTAVSQALLALKQRHLKHMQAAHSSPYFARCDVTLEGERDNQTYYFGKFSLPDLNIYSWAAPAARIRFDEPGPFSYTSETDNQVSGQLERIDQYLIAQGHIRFMSTASNDEPRTLVYQEKFVTHKSEFMLPEIVERMEKAQDEIIRADAFGSFLISGPAGSGKTTLALHRIAYLLQAPEHAERFDPRTILVLVQDAHSKKYFESLLPSLGIVDVGISTFDIWAMQLLGITHGTYVPQYGHTENERDVLAAAKYRALKKSAVTYGKNHFAMLHEAYDAHLTDEDRTVLARQKKEQCFDRIDLALLLQAKLRHDGKFRIKGRIYSPKADGTFRTRVGDIDLTYSLVLVDEVQNYLPEQIAILQSCISPETKAMTYVGDLAQQTSLFTLRDWSQVGERFDEKRMVRLEKVYRSTRPILEYIRSQGFVIDIPNGIREGAAVREYRVRKDEVQTTVRNIVQKNKDVLVGIIALQSESLESFGDLTSERCKILTAVEAQGLEFDVVVCIRDAAEIGNEYTDTLREEKQRIVRDQLYVALTRAMNELHVIT